MQFSVTGEGIVVKKGFKSKLIPFDTIRSFEIDLDNESSFRTQDREEFTDKLLGYKLSRPEVYTAIGKYNIAFVDRCLQQFHKRFYKEEELAPLLEEAKKNVQIYADQYIKDHLVRRYSVFLLGLFIASMGVAFSTVAELGTSPVASVPYSVSRVSDLLTFGGWLNLLSVIQITVQIFLLKSRCNWLEITIQTILAFVYGYLTNFSCWLLEDILLVSYGAKLLFMLLGCIILALGIWVQFKGGVAMLPGEAMNRAISQVTGKRYENVKIFFDIFYITLATVICLSFLGKPEGVREGSIVAAVLVGLLIKFYNKIFNKLKDKVTGKEKKE